MKRTTINLDLDLLDDAADALGTARQKLEALTKLEFPDLDWETVKAMRRPRTFDHLRD